MTALNMGRQGLPTALLATPDGISLSAQPPLWLRYLPAPREAQEQS
jgi:hypothetical protein